MAEQSSNLRPYPVRVIRWLGHDILAEHPAIQMLHEARAAETQREKSLPLEQRPSYKMRQARIFARGQNNEYKGADANEIAMSPQEKAAAQAAQAAAAEAAAALAAKAAATAAADAAAPLTDGPALGREPTAG
jgi:ParB-like chromosome segregation protein Spo0J